MNLNPNKNMFNIQLKKVDLFFNKEHCPNKFKNRGNTNTKKLTMTSLTQKFRHNHKIYNKSNKEKM